MECTTVDWGMLQNFPCGGELWLIARNQIEQFMLQY